MFSGNFSLRDYNNNNRTNVTFSVVNTSPVQKEVVKYDLMNDEYN